MKEISSCAIPQQLGRAWKVFGHLPRNYPEPSAPEPSGTSSAICPGTFWNLISHLPRNLPKPHQPSAPEPSSAICIRTLQNLISHLRRNFPEPLSAICPGTPRNLINHLHQNPPKPHQPSAPEPSKTSSAICAGTLQNLICAGTLRNLISYLRRNPPLHHLSASEGSGTLRNFLQNLVLQLHRTAPELFWAKDPIASFAVGENTRTCDLRMLFHTEIQMGPLFLGRSQFNFIWEPS